MDILSNLAFHSDEQTKVERVDYTDSASIDETKKPFENIIASSSEADESGNITINLNESPSDEVAEWIVKNRPDIIYKDDIFVVNVYVRKAEEKEWRKSVDAEVGEEVEFQIHFKNTTDEKVENVMVLSSLPRYVKTLPNSLMSITLQARIVIRNI